VPDLASQPAVRVTQPQLTPGGIPEPARRASLPQPDVATIVMSRDGSEGWALGSSTNTPQNLSEADGTNATTVYHFDGASWKSCAIDGVAGVLPADPACASLSALTHNSRDSGYGGPQVKIFAAARVPLEQGSDPSRAGDFEVVAIGTALEDPPGDSVRPAILRYRHGSWSIDRQAMHDVYPGGSASGYARWMAIASIAFTSPDDGWIVGHDAQDTVVFHFGPSHRWTRCGAGDTCSDTGLIQPKDSGGATLLSSAHLVAAGRRVYMYGGQQQTPASTGSLSTPPRAWLLHLDPGGQWTSDSLGATAGEITALSVIPEGDHYRGWALVSSNGGTVNTGNPAASGSSGASLLRLGGDGAWQPWTSGELAGQPPRCSSPSRAQARRFQTSHF